MSKKKTTILSVSVPIELANDLEMLRDALEKKYHFKPTRSELVTSMIQLAIDIMTADGTAPKTPKDKGGNA